MLILMLGVFMLGSSGFALNQRQVDCQAVAGAAWQSVIDQGGSYELAAQVWSAAHWKCEQNQR